MEDAHQFGAAFGARVGIDLFEPVADFADCAARAALVLVKGQNVLPRPEGGQVYVSLALSVNDC